uniref:Uncharacterized protein n=1 Tax=Ficus carica TaxID=3494 RepID=A0AA88CRI3_FICCA|nr:hypothetical protein TIFTF001_051578 [Ficus carica]GMN27266.1 hypothetical protein TIFTF001_051581 [Ficus carica]
MSLLMGSILVVIIETSKENIAFLMSKTPCQMRGNNSLNSLREDANNRYAWTPLLSDVPHNDS